MGVRIEEEYRANRAKTRHDDAKKPFLSAQPRQAAKSAFNHKVKNGHQGKAYSWKPTKEVTVKATGAAKTAFAIRKGINYITRQGDIEAYYYDGEGNEKIGQGKAFNEEIIEGMAENNNYHKKFRGQNIEHVKNFVFSPPPDANVSREDALSAMTELLKEQFPDHAFVAAYHSDKEEHPHVHVNIKLRNEKTGKRLDLKNRVLRDFRRGFAKKLQERGYDVTATFKSYMKHEREYKERAQVELPKRMRNVYKLVDFGETNYQNKAGAKRTPYITYETLKGGHQVTIWGKNLKPHFDAEKLQKGDLIKIKKLEPTLVRTPLLNDDGTISNYRETKLNNWQIENIGIEKERATEFKKELVLQPDKQAIQKQLERKHEHKHNIDFTLKHDFLKNSPQHKKFKQEHERDWK